MIDISFFPGCSLATTARENKFSIETLCRRLGYNLISLNDWNCCGSSSVYGLEPDAALRLSFRNLSLAPEGRALLIACPKCLMRLRQAQLKLKKDEGACETYEVMWKRPVDEKLKIVSFFELLEQGGSRELLNGGDVGGLKGMKFVAYYGCMLNDPPGMRGDISYYGKMETVLSSLGAVPMEWAYASRCCGTFLSVARPEIATAAVNGILSDALASGADCIVTACAMCHLNLEVRHGLPKSLPVFHFSEILALALDSEAESKWFARHLVDPRPLLKTYGFTENSHGA